MADDPQQTCTMLFSLIPKNVTNERPIAPEVAKSQHKSRVQWDATDGRNGGALRTVRECWKWKKFQCRAGEKKQGHRLFSLQKARSVFCAIFLEDRRGHRGRTEENLRRPRRNRTRRKNAAAMREEDQEHPCSRMEHGKRTSVDGTRQGNHVKNGAETGQQ